MEGSALSPFAMVLYAVLIYACAGVFVGGFALLTRATRLDSRLPAAPFRVRLVLLPGVALLWPLVLFRAQKGTR